MNFSVNSITSNALKVTGTVCMITATAVLVVGGVKVYKVSKTADKTLNQATATIKDLSDTAKEAKLLIQDGRIIVTKAGNTINTTMDNLGKTLTSMGASAKETLQIFNDAFKQITSSINTANFGNEIKKLINAISKTIDIAADKVNGLQMDNVNRILQDGSAAMNKLKTTVEEVTTNGGGGEGSENDSGIKLTSILKTILKIFKAMYGNNNQNNQPT